MCVLCDDSAGGSPLSMSSFVILLTYPSIRGLASKFLFCFLSFSQCMSPNKQTSTLSCASRPRDDPKTYQRQTWECICIPPYPCFMWYLVHFLPCVLQKSVGNKIDPAECSNPGGSEWKEQHRKTNWGLHIRGTTVQALPKPLEGQC